MIIDNNIQVDRRFAEQQLIHICAKTMSHASDIFQWKVELLMLQINFIESFCMYMLF